MNDLNIFNDFEDDTDNAACYKDAMDSGAMPGAGEAPPAGEASATGENPQGMAQRTRSRTHAILHTSASKEMAAEEAAPIAGEAPVTGEASVTGVDTEDLAPSTPTRTTSPHNQSSSGSSRTVVEMRPATLCVLLRLPPSLLLPSTSLESGLRAG
jgi:hypothetical protein